MLSQVYGWFSKAAIRTRDQEQKGLAAGSATAMSPPQSITAYNDICLIQREELPVRENHQDGLHKLHSPLLQRANICNISTRMYS